MTSLKQLCLACSSATTSGGRADGKRLPSLGFPGSPFRGPSQTIFPGPLISPYPVFVPGRSICSACATPRDHSPGEDTQTSTCPPEGFSSPLTSKTIPQRMDLFYFLFMCLSVCVCVYMRQRRTSDSLEQDHM